ncbi:MAG: Gfo/Idh/MocA family oxidoreductase [Solirubrobacterales bacterium]
MARRVGLVGFGLAGSVFHAPLIDATDGLELATVITRNPERAAQARGRYSGVEVAADAQAALEGHDLVVVATPNDSHADVARAAIEAGIAVVVDKPLAPTAAQARELVELAERRGVGLTVFMNRRWDSDHLTVGRLIADGRLGDVLLNQSRFERWKPKPAEAWRETLTPEAGGGVLLDLGTHLVDQALGLFGAVRSVYGEVSHRRGGPADDDAFIALEHESGVRSHLRASIVEPAPGPRLRVSGTEAAYLVEAVDGQEDALRAGDRPGPGWGVESRERWGRLVRGSEEEPIEPEPGAWPKFYAQVAAALADSGPMPVDPRDAVTVLETLERARAG